MHKQNTEMDYSWDMVRSRTLAVFKVVIKVTAVFVLLVGFPHVKILRKKNASKSIFQTAQP